MPRAGDLLEGRRYILGHRTPRPLLVNAVVVNGLIMASGPLLAVLLLATVTSPRTAIAAAGVLLPATPLLLPRRAKVPGKKLTGVEEAA
ncbi:hypothetical protein [Streptomyces brevispora]|uniref:Uncharacterized protein n=1 Tax=Streptomyces brevispora TaxID=887462 RepID=A0A561V2P8_9ACTN|nr:hypothetical protein FHX80_114362 [Streptomyces brevispora]